MEHLFCSELYIWTNLLSHRISRSRRSSLLAISSNVQNLVKVVATWYHTISDCGSRSCRLNGTVATPLQLHTHRQSRLHTKTTIQMAHKRRGDHSDTQDAEYVDGRVACPPSLDSSSSSSPSISPKEVQELVSNASKRPRVSLPLPESLVNIAKEKVECPDFDYALLLEELGYYGLIDTAYYECTTAQQKHPFATDNTFRHVHEWKYIGTPILADIPLALLQALVNGTLPRKVCHPLPEDPDVRTYFDDRNLEAHAKDDSVEISHWVTRQHENGGDVPTIYARILHDEQGRSPTPNQLLQVLDFLRKYISGEPAHDKLCTSIDNQVRQQTSSEAEIRTGRHTFLQGKSDRVQTIVTFVNALQNLLGDVDYNVRHQPWGRNLKYIGYTSCFIERTNEQDYKTSSWLMDLFSHVCMHLFREGGHPVFDFRSYIVAYPINIRESHLAEELLCRISRSYYYGGMGFNLQNGGLGVASSKFAALDVMSVAAIHRTLDEARHEKSQIYEEQLWADYHAFDKKYIQKCKENDNRAEILALKKDIEDLEARREELKRNRKPISALYAAAQSKIDCLEQIKQLPICQDKLRVERVQEAIRRKVSRDAQRWAARRA